MKDYAEEGQTAKIRQSDTIGSNMDRVRDGLAKLDEMVKVLEEHISPILLPPMESEGMKDGGPVAMVRQSDIAEQLGNFADRIDRRVRQMADVITRVNI